MTPQIRVRRHTDGRVALGAHGVWVIVPGENWWRKDDSQCSGDGWSELLVAELPEPDGWIDAVGDNDEDARTPYWGLRDETITAWTDGIEANDYGLENDLDSIRSDALKMLAAVAACERYRAERLDDPKENETDV